MPYITSVERMGIRKGLEQGLERGLQQGRQSDIIRILEVRFSEIQPQLRVLIRKIEDLEVLGTLLVQAVTIQSLEGFTSVASQYVARDELESPSGEQTSGTGSDQLD